jgi:molybdopterin molybdotransferase
VSCDHAGSDRLLGYREALETVLANVLPLGPEAVLLADSLGAYLAEPATALHHSPRFEQSAMDGYAVRSGDVAAARDDHPVTLTLVDEMPAGDVRRLTLKAGETIKVFTGSRLPGGTEAVVMKEFVTLVGDRADVAWRVREGDHIRRVGEEFRRGDVILPAGTHVTPPVVGMLAMLGRKSATVGRRPRTVVITMGDELVAPGVNPGPGQVNDANGPAVVAALQALGVTAVKHVLVKDDPAALRAAMSSGLAGCDILITVGGASVGDHDHVQEARLALGIKDLFARVAIRPGKPNIFGLAPDGTPVFGLPGNPVSALVSFHQLVKPALVRLMGGVPRPEIRLPVVLDQGASQKKGRLGWLRGVLRFGDEPGAPLTAGQVAGQGSHMLSGLAQADVLLEIPANSDGIPAGGWVQAVPLDWHK